MITITVHSKKGSDLYKLLINKEFQLRKMNRGTFVRRSGRPRSKRDIWVHKGHPGWVEFSKGLNGSLTSTVKSKAKEDEWHIFDSFISFLTRHFKSEIACINITF